MRLNRAEKNIKLTMLITTMLSVLFHCFLLLNISRPLVNPVAAPNAYQVSLREATVVGSSVVTQSSAAQIDSSKPSKPKTSNPKKATKSVSKPKPTKAKATIETAKPKSIARSEDVDHLVSSTEVVTSVNSGGADAVAVSQGSAGNKDDKTRKDLSELEESTELSSDVTEETLDATENNEKRVSEITDKSASMVEKATQSAIEQAPKPSYVLGSASNPKPAYPSVAARRGWQGDVVLGVNVAEDGSISNILIIKGSQYSVLNHVAWETVKSQWTFTPAMQGDDSVASYIEVPISFRLKN